MGDGGSAIAAAVIALAPLARPWAAVPFDVGDASYLRWQSRQGC